MWNTWNIHTFTLKPGLVPGILMICLVDLCWQRKTFPRPSKLLRRVGASSGWWALYAISTEIVFWLVRHVCLCDTYSWGFKHLWCCWVFSNWSVMGFQFGASKSWCGVQPRQNELASKGDGTQGAAASISYSRKGSFLQNITASRFFLLFPSSESHH